MLPWEPTEYTKPCEKHEGNLASISSFTYRLIWISNARGRGHRDAGDTQVCGGTCGDGALFDWGVWLTLVRLRLLKLLQEVIADTSVHACSVTGTTGFPNLFKWVLSEFLE